jgi:hypothetical protein
MEVTIWVVVTIERPKTKIALIIKVQPFRRFLRLQTRAQPRLDYGPPQLNRRSHSKSVVIPAGLPQCATIAVVIKATSAAKLGSEWVEDVEDVTGVVVAGETVIENEIGGDILDGAGLWKQGGWAEIVILEEGEAVGWGDAGKDESAAGGEG